MLLPDYRVSEDGVHAVFHGTRYMAPRVRRLLDFLVARFADAGAALTRDFDIEAGRPRQPPDVAGPVA